MQLIRGLHNLRPAHRDCVLTIGNFDGVHRGHRAILAQLEDLAAQTGVPGALMTFEPHPREHFAREHAPPRLTRLREKVFALRACGLDRMIVVRFDEALSTMSPASFIDDVLVAALGVRAVVIGDDFRFGHRAEGNFETLGEAGERHGFQVLRHATFSVGGQRVSSSRIRDALAHGELDQAAELLGRPYGVLGRVAHGRELGRTIGFATANIALRRVATPLSGVFAVWVHRAAAQPRPAMANLGVRPTVDGLGRLLEVHLFDFDGDLYGRELEIEFVRKLREEQKFDGLEALAAQLTRDADAARAILREHPALLPAPLAV